MGRLPCRDCRAVAIRAMFEAVDRAIALAHFRYRGARRDLSRLAAGRRTPRSRLATGTQGICRFMPGSLRLFPLAGRWYCSLLGPTFDPDFRSCSEGPHKTSKLGKAFRQR